MMYKRPAIERRTAPVYIREAIVSGLIVAVVYAAGWQFTTARIFEMGVAGLIVFFGLGVAIGLIMEWQLDDDPED